MLKHYQESAKKQDSFELFWTMSTLERVITRDAHAPRAQSLWENHNPFNESITDDFE